MRPVLRITTPLYPANPKNVLPDQRGFKWISLKAQKLIDSNDAPSTRWAKDRGQRIKSTGSRAQGQAFGSLRGNVKRTDNPPAALASSDRCDP